MVAIGNVDELRSNTQPVACFAHAPFKDGVYLQLAPDFADVFALSFKGKRRSPRRHSKCFDLRQRIDDFLGDAVAENSFSGSLLMLTKARTAMLFSGTSGTAVDEASGSLAAAA